MRLTPDMLYQITRLKRKGAQVKWFKLHLGADVPRDHAGAILTDAAYQKLVEKRLGLAPELPNSLQKTRPSIRLVDKKAA
ncbi:MAG: DUF4224 domain-containing protein [Candidatus Obscuribacterales bacterium]|nr:DUF4224 domain-containing protein [Candidatus Obscuribacterales bacterium]